MMTKYSPLETHLRAIQLNSITLTFSEIEDILGSRLPQSSYIHDAHWRGTTPGRPGGAIGAAGWKVDKIDHLGRALRLSRPHPERGVNGVRESAPVMESRQLPSAFAQPVRNWQALEAHAADYFSRLWATDLAQRSVSVRGVAKSFDLVSSDGRFVGDAKQYTNIATPAAKWQGIAEYVWLLQHVDADRRFLVFGGDGLVAERFLRRWRPLIAPVEFYHVSESGHRLL